MLIMQHDMTQQVTHHKNYYLLFGWYPRLAIDSFLGTEDLSQQHTGNKQDYVVKLKKRLNFAYKVAKDKAVIQSQRSKTYYDKKIRESTLEVGDRVLMRNVTPKGKLDDKWEKEPFLVIEIPNEDIPVYRLKRENGKGPVKTLHRNLLLPLNYIPYTVPFSTLLRNSNRRASPG